jgi:hypothetical protein
MTNIVAYKLLNDNAVLVLPYKVTNKPTGEAIRSPALFTLKVALPFKREGVGVGMGFNTIPTIS